MTSNLSIFLVDDDKAFLKALEYHLQHKLKHTIKIKSFLTGEECLKNISLKPNIIVLDYMLNGNHSEAMNGVEVLQKIKNVEPETTVIIVSGQEKMEVAIDTIKNGAYDYVLKNPNALFKIQTAIKNIINEIALTRRMKTYNFWIRIFAFIIILSIVVVLVRTFFLYK